VGVKVGAGVGYSGGEGAAAAADAIIFISYTFYGLYY